MARCEDYPCCGHTDGLPCDWKPPDYRNDPHALCDHENGVCEIDDPDDDDGEDEDLSGPEMVMAAWAATQPPDNFVNDLACGHQVDTPDEKRLGDILVCLVHGPQEIVSLLDPRPFREGF
jgi:hypothetical protein